MSRDTEDIPGRRKGLADMAGQALLAASASGSLLAVASACRAEIQADINGRVQAQIPSPRSEAAVRRLIDELRLGKPEYDRRSPWLARRSRRQIREEQGTFAKLGSLESLTFTSVGPAGPVIYRATFANGTQEWNTWLSPEGRVDIFDHGPVAPRT